MTFKKFRRQEVVPGGSIRGKDGPEVVLVWSLCDSSVKKVIQIVLDVACECRPIQVILRSFKKFRRQEVVPGGSRRGASDTRRCQISYLGYTNTFR